MRLLVMSDVHGNLSAFLASLRQAGEVDGILLLGDLINYGMRSNEIIEEIKRLQVPVLANIWGNHEQAVMQEEYERFSSDRGRDCAKYTAEKLSENSRTYMKENMDMSGMAEIDIQGKKCLIVHGSLQDCYWHSVVPQEIDHSYEIYDYVFSGHSHIPMYYEKYFEADNRLTRNKKKTIFINPGSVGQPRNIDARAQFVLWDTQSDCVCFEKAVYPIEEETRLFEGSVDNFYRDRLEHGV